MDKNQWVKENYSHIEKAARQVLGPDQAGDGISLYYLYLLECDDDFLPENARTHARWYMKLLKNKTSPLNYQYKNVVRLSSEYEPPYTDEKLDLYIDLKDERLIDFIQNNRYTDKWIKIYRVVIEKKVELDFFEYIMYDYVFNRGMSIREIAKITKNSLGWIYKYRKSVIEKIKKAIDELD